MSNEQPIDGGLTALAGYLYQTVGVLGMKAGAYQLNNLSGTSDLEVLLILVKQNELLYEYLDQDAAIRDSLGIDDLVAFVLVQFKFSRQVLPPKITPNELTKILKRLKVSTGRAQMLGQNVSRYVLISNRELGPGANDMQHNAQTPGSAQHNGDLSSILRQLRVIPPISMATWEEALYSFARTYGCIDRDIRKGIDERVGSIIRQTVDSGSPSITKDDLVEAFTGFPMTRQLTPMNVAERSKEQLKAFFAEHHLQEKHALVRRTVLDAISQKAEEHAIVVVCGLGGNGKTVTLWHWTEEFLSSNVPGQKGSYVSIMAAEDVQTDCLTHILCNWAELPSHHDWRAEKTPEQILERLQSASPNASHPIVYLNIDAIDEEQRISDGSHQAIKQLLNWFWKEELDVQLSGHLPQATIILTCRDEKEIAKGWLHLLSPFGDTSVQLPTVAVNDFSDKELLEAARLGLPEKLADRLEKSLLSEKSDFPSLTGRDEIPILQGTDPYLQPVDPQILEALHHPALWRCMLVLNDPSIQSDILDGDPVALQKLAQKFVLWFCIKAEVRGLGHNLKSDELETIITAITQGTKEEKHLRLSRVQWINLACSTNLVPTIVAERLYNEAISAGLIGRIDLNSWRWRHQFIGDYLSATFTR